jgi:hypothetical protein
MGKRPNFLESLFKEKNPVWVRVTKEVRIYYFLIF